MKGKLVLFLIIFAVILIFAMIRISIYLNEDSVRDSNLYQFDEQIEKEERSRYNENGSPGGTSEEIIYQDEPVVGEVTDFAEVDPRFPGGEQAMIRFIQENVVYPEIDREMGNQGTVYVQFVVLSTGDITNVKVLKGTSSRSLDREAMRVVKAMPRWSPGQQNGEKVNVRFQIPIKFTIQ